MQSVTDAQAADAACLDRLLAERHSCRAFLPDQVPREVIERILAMSQRTASWCNSQAWQLVVAGGAATERFRAALLKAAGSGEQSWDIPPPKAYLGAYLDRRRECGFQLYESVGIAKGDREASARQGLENFRLFGAPHVAIITSPEPLGPYGAVDCGAYVANFMLAAKSLGVASIAQAALASQSALVRSHFRIPEDRQVVCGISFGYEDLAHPANAFRTRRAPVTEVVTWVED